MLNNLKQFNLPELEEKVLKFWKERQIFEKSLKKGKKKFIFYEGPPTANGRPGIHHVLSRSFKDIILRYKTMQGYHVPRKAGWDTHGLPVEIEVEKQLGLRSKKDIEAYGIERFNEQCRASVWKYKDEWEKLTERMGFWLDMRDPYITYENAYMESLWYIFSTVWKKKLLYTGHKVLPWCPRCGTALSSHELAQGYKEVADTSAYVKFKIEPGQQIANWETTDRTYLLSWTTTPWTLPGNVALAVGEDIAYVAVSRGTNTEEIFIFAKERDEALGLAGARVATWQGSALVGLSYEPLFDVPALKSEKSYKVYGADFVTTTDGTGIVHTAVMYGEDDYALGIKEKLPQHHTVDETGRFTDAVHGLAGMAVKADETTSAIMERLKKENRLFREESYTHEYPFCWRCSSRLIYYARTSRFIKMSALKKKLLEANEKIDWHPAHIREGRFGEWLREVKDWAISRDRYWGTPLPIWQCEGCGNEEAIGSIAELEKRQGKKARNTYFALRHGEAESNAKNIIDSGDHEVHLTPKGRREAAAALKELQQALGKQRVDIIIASPVLRAKETAALAREALGAHEVLHDDRVREIQLGSISGSPVSLYHDLYPTYADRFAKRPEGGESLRDVRTRVWEFLRDCEARYEGKRILIVSHEYPIWMLEAVAGGWSEAEAIAEKDRRGEDFIGTAGTVKLSLRMLPRNRSGEADLHRPYIDAVTFTCKKCKRKMHRVPEVADVWFDSGAMPFAQAHWPFGSAQGKPFAQTKNAKPKDQKLLYPADYIAEGVDQTRGWFYTLLAVAMLLGKRAPYKHVLSLGHILDAHGQKMSKSKGNVVDPWVAMGTHGVDAARWYFFTAGDPGAPRRFDARDLVAARQTFTLLYNSFVFLKTYGMPGKQKIKNKKSKTKKHVLDRWIEARLAETVAGVTRSLETYDIAPAARAIDAFVLDLSRWYIRRSRERFSDMAPAAARRAASETLAHALGETAKLMAPFAPFFAEGLYRSLTDAKHATGGANGAESVHLATWPRGGAVNKKLIADMGAIRDIASRALALRAEAGIRVRQPVAMLKIKAQKSKLKNNSEILPLLRDEINVKKIIFDEKIEQEMALDTEITPALRDEGIVREAVRTVQQLRQDAGLTVRDTVTVSLVAAEEVVRVLQRHEREFLKAVRAERAAFSTGTIREKQVFDAAINTKFDGREARIGIRKI